MSIDNVVVAPNLGNEFDVGGIVANEIKLKVDGTTVTVAADGTVSATSISVTEIGVCLDDGAGGALQAIRRATFTNGIQTSLIYVDAADGVTVIPFSSIVDCCL